MLATDPYFEIRLLFAAVFGRHFHQLTHSFEIKHLERIGLKQSFIQILAKEFTGIITAVAEGHLREVVCTEGEKLRLFCDLIGHQRSARYFDHGTHFILNLFAKFIKHLLGRSIDHKALAAKLLRGSDKRNHDFRDHLDTSVFQFNGSLENCAGLHLRNFWIGNSQAASPVTEHGVEFFQRPNDSRKLLRLDAERFCHAIDLFWFMWQKLMQRRIEQPNGDRIALHRLKDFDEILSLERKQIHQRIAALLLAFRHNHTTHRRNSLVPKEHMLGAAETDTFGAKLQRFSRI